MYGVRTVTLPRGWMIRIPNMKFRIKLLSPDTKHQLSEMTDAAFMHWVRSAWVRLHDHHLEFDEMEKNCAETNWPMGREWRLAGNIIS